ncbi:hypothetical protein NEOLEDRAFT_1179527 [Neolentinus lepideus HHB14362 ss-1]|uniref:Uncharacterized protein n=1 Tax=Neolentinus lepideus HHB14362 ss-1 TaxID=1314782 RepID=A0A165RUF1_9AGAM|nr:hypothetical protein NEOLEDRAFT_1179527 [Neolentinus lepideus HHB14362 ss-1]
MPRKKPTKSTSLVPSTYNEDERSEDTEEVDTRDNDSDPKMCHKCKEPPLPSEVNIKYNVSVFSAVEMKKSKNKRESKNSLLHLSSMEPFDTWKAQILVKIDMALSPKKIEWSNYKVSFSILHISTLPLNVTTSDNYDIMLGCALKMKNGAVTVMVAEKAHKKKWKRDEVVEKRKDKENADTEDEGLENSEGNGDKEDDEELGGRKKKKTKILKKSDIDKSNVVINNNIKALMNWWSCSMGHCTSNWCLVDPVELRTLHFALSMAHLNIWAAAMEAGDSVKATIDKPTNHKMFDALPANKTGMTSLLTECCNQMKASKDSRPVFNINIPAEFAALFHHPSLPVYPPAPVPNLTSVVPPLLASVNGSSLGDSMLIPSGNTCGFQMTIKDFCTSYELGPAIQQKLLDNGFLKMHSFQYIALSDLKEMSFHHGEIAELHDAIAHWCFVKAQ